MPVLGTPRTFHKKFAFVVEIERVQVAAFTRCSELSVEMAVVEQWEGGSLIPIKEPGRATFSDITLERGVAKGDSDLYSWFQEVANVSANAGLVTPLFKRDLAILQLDRDGAVIRSWEILNAWPMKFVAGDWDNEADENVIESVTLSIDSFRKLGS